jgi:hypothetical protein
MWLKKGAEGVRRGRSPIKWDRRAAPREGLSLASDDSYAMARRRSSLGRPCHCAEAAPTSVDLR